VYRCLCVHENTCATYYKGYQSGNSKQLKSACSLLDDCDRKDLFRGFHAKSMMYNSNYITSSQSS